MITALFSGATQAQVSQCLIPLQQFSAPPELQRGHIIVESDRTEIKENTYATFAGDVSVYSEQSIINAETAEIDKVAQLMNASGNVSYRNPQIKVTSDNVELDLLSGKLQLDESDYQLAVFNGRGEAQLISLDTRAGIELNDVSFSTCPENDEDWVMKASSITLSPDELWGEARNTRFYIKGVPVFYLPYFAFPISDQRQTGLLFPEFSTSSSTGLTYEQPFYWNIAPNYDMTIAPRLMTNRGLQLKTEFRYLVDQHLGQFNIEYLADDRDTQDDDARYFYRFVHTGKLSDNWYVQADINGLSDDNYIVDLGSDFYSRADTHLYQTFGLTYFSEQVDFSVQFRDFEVIGDHPSTYRALPEMKLAYQTDKLAGFEFRLNSELAYFENDLPDTPTATRFHVAPSLAYPVYSTWGEFLAEVSVLNTYYHQDNIDNTELSDEVNRTLGQGRLYGAINFERPATWFGDQVTQTLEPKVQYLYTSYEDQSDIGLYDTTRLLNDFDGLFRGQEFTGLDRISDHNQITVGLTSRILDKNSREQFKVSVGQIFYLSDNQVLAANKEDDRSALASELDWQLGSKWFAHAEVQVSTRTDKVERSSVSLEYQQDSERLVQLNHRYVRDLSGEEIDQIGLSASWPIAKNWQWVGRWYKDMTLNRTIETYTGIQYESCCWSVQLVAQRYLSNRFDNSGTRSTDEFDSSINLKFSFKFGDGGSGSVSRDMLSDGLFGYRQPYILNR